MRKSLPVIGASALLAISLVGCSSGSSASTDPAADAAVQSKVTYTDDGGLTRYSPPGDLPAEIVTRGPDGEVPVWYNTVVLSKDEVAQLKDQGLRAAIVWHLDSPFMSAITDGVEGTFEDLGVEVVSVTSAEGDDAKLQNNIQTALTLDPDIIVSIALDPVADKAAFRPAVDSGVKLVFASVKPDGYEPGTDYVSLVTYDIAGLGQVTADAMGKGVGDGGKVGVIYFDANFYVTNQREDVFADTLAEDYPGIEVVAREPMSDPSKVEDVALAMMAQNPEIQAIFAPWDTAAEGVVAALRQLGRSDVKVYTIDLGATNAVDMANEGNIVEMTSTLAVEFGNTLAISGAYGVLGKEIAPMVIVPAFAVDKSNLEDGWEMTFGTSLPADIQAALQ
jgi:ribose transport system substrate-binding protein